MTKDEIIEGTLRSLLESREELVQRLERWGKVLPKQGQEIDIEELKKQYPQEPIR